MKPSAKIMLIDDDESLHVLVKRLMDDAGYAFCSAYGGEEGLRALAAEKPDVVFLSAKGDIVDKSIGFKAGGDDYVVKPFSSDELMLRIEAHLRRHRDDLAFAKAVTRGGSNKVGDLEILFNQYEVRLRGQVVDLTAKEFEILALLAANPGQVLTRAQIYEHIWGEGSEVDESSITVFMRKIREKIEDNPSQPRYLLTVWRVGYKFAERV